MKRFLILVAVMLAIGNATQAQTRDTLLEKFNNPGYDAAPWAIWYWMYGAVGEAGVRADLEAMKAAGIGGAYLMPIKSSDYAQAPAFEPVADQLTPQFWKMIRTAAGKADTLGLKLGVHICDGFALAGGPWITPELSMQKVVWSDTVVVVDKNSGGFALARPEAFEGFYKDIAIYAFPVKEASLGTHSGPQAKVSVSTPDDHGDIGRLLDPANTRAFRSDEACWILYDFGRPFICRSMEMMLPGYAFQATRLVVEASDNGRDFTMVKPLVPPRHGWQNNGINYTFSFPATTARYFRFSWAPEGSEPGAEDLDAAKWKPSLGVNAILLSGEPKIDQYEGKSAAVWRISPDMTSAELPEALCIKLSETVDLTDKAENGLVPYYELPVGRWRILRMGHTSTGQINTTGGAGRGLESDKFNPVAVRTQLNGWFEEFFRQVGQPLAGRVFKTMHVDSWECGSQNWSETFRREFLKRRGYDVVPYMPLYAGVPMESAERSEAVLRDIRQTVAELVRDVFYEELSACAKRYDCRLSAECVAPTMVSDGMLHYEKVDLPMGEFWFRSPTHDKLNDMMDAISGGHIYGKKIIQAEGFTQLRTMWDENPGMLKTLLDRNYALGMNKLSFHVWVQNPWMDRQPGMTLDGIGLCMQRDQTWFPLAGAWVDYIKRCQALLQSGAPVIDVAVYTGGDFPRRAVLPDRLVSSLPGIFGPKRVESERLRLENAGQPLRTMPVGVSHSAGVPNPEDWIDPLNGYAYDSFNEDVFLKATAVNGRMVLASGQSYKVVLFPLPGRMTPNAVYSDAVIRQIERLRRASVMILTPDQLPYTTTDFGPAVEPDFLAIDNKGRPARNVAWTHRREGANDIYFVSNQEE
ncbi:MAG: DNA-binding protein, partial [Rikenellaceae bacterium]|nr:DNA-binding protein [Rikenellaceae bacterium]